MNNRHLLLSLQILLRCYTGPVIDACLQAIKSATREIAAEKQYILLRKIKNCDIATNDIEFPVKRLALSSSAKQKLRNKLMSVKIRDALRTIAVRKAEERLDWKQCKRIIPGTFLQGYMDIWYKQRTDVAQEIKRDTRRSSITSLRNGIEHQLYQIT